MNRNFNYDFIRASTIFVIVLSHVSQMTMPHDYVYSFIEIGKFSIEMFFCLSGYLVGTLYWREYKKTGTVDLWWFWLRRWSRTFPLYYIFLAISFLSVYITRQEAFSWQYLVFLQNYFVEIPFFLVSWTLCIEEHFYVFIPLLLSLLLIKRNIKLVLAVGIVMAFLPMIFRVYEITQVNGAIIPFGYHVTASHLRFDGLVLGVFFAYFSVYNIPIRLPKLRYLCLISLAVIFSSFFFDKEQFYVYGYFAVAFCLAMVIYALRNREFRIPERLMQFYQYSALSSYTLFLSHPLIIHFSLKLLKAVHIENELAKFSITLLLIFISTYVIYQFFELKLLDWRDKYVPARKPSFLGKQPIRNN